MKDKWRWMPEKDCSVFYDKCPKCGATAGLVFHTGMKNWRCSVCGYERKAYFQAKLTEYIPVEDQDEQKNAD